MTAVEVHDTETDAAGRPAPKTLVTISLFASTDGSVAGQNATAEAHIVDSYRPTLDQDTAKWVAQLEPNADLLPAGTVYVVTRQLPGRPALATPILVPSTVGPHWAGALEVDLPGTLPSSALSVALQSLILNGSDAWLQLYGALPDSLIVGAITRDVNGAATGAPVVWPDGTSGTYTADTISTAFRGAVDAYHITYGDPVTRTVTQPAVTRDPTSGAVINRPALVVT